MNEQQHDSLEEQAYPVNQKIAFATSTAVAMGLADWIAHFGPTGLVVGGLASYVAWKHGPELYQQVQGAFPRPVGAQAEQTTVAQTVRHPAKRSWFERAFNIPAADTDEDDSDTILVEEEEDLPLPDTLELGDLRVHVDSVFSKRLAILGMSGSGKSNLVAVLIEEVGQFDAPLIVLDHKPEYGPLCQQPYLSTPVRATAQNLTRQTASAVGQDIMRRRLQVVVDLTTYKSDAEAALVMTGLIDGVSSYQKAQPDDTRIPCTFVLEEAHYWLPQQAQLSTIQSVRHPQTGQSLLSYVEQKFFNMAKIGRYLGIGLVIATQRPTAVNKELISQATWRFLLQVLDPADLKVYREYGVPNEIAQALTPKRGDAYVIGPDGVHGLYHIRRRYSPDVAKSPGLANIRNAGVRERSPFPQVGGIEQGNTPVGTFPGNRGMSENRPVERAETVPAPWEHSPASGNAGNVPQEDETTGEEAEEYSHEEETQVLLAYAELMRTGNGVFPSRRAIKEHLGWSSRQFSRVIKPVCDKHGIAVRD